MKRKLLSAALLLSHFSRVQLYATPETDGSPPGSPIPGILQARTLEWVPRPARGAGTLIPSAQRLVWAAKQALGKAALGALFA